MQVLQNDIDIQATEVFTRNWAAIHLMAFREDGSPLLDSITGEHQRRYKYIINEGSSRSSKTYSLIDCYDLYARRNAGKRQTIWRDTKTDAIGTVYADMEVHLKATGRWLNGHRFHATTHTLTYHSGSKIEIRGTDETTAHGLTQAVAWFNEPYKVSKTTFDQIDQRTSDFIFIDWNPKEAHWIDDLKKDPRTIVIHSTFKDNAFCPREQRIKILSYQPVSLCALVLGKVLTEAEAKEYDLINNPAGYSCKDLNELIRCRENEFKRSADAFNWMVYGLGTKGERPNRIFRWEECSPELYDSIDAREYAGSDWGAVDPWAVGKAKYQDGALYIRECNYTSENEIRRNLTATELAQIGTDDEGLVSWYFKKFNIPYRMTVVCDPNRTLKIKSLRGAGWDYAVAADKPPGSILDGIDLLKGLRVYFTSDSPNVKYEQENYSYQVDRYGVVLEEPEDLNNHHMDWIRYVVTFLRSQGIIRKI